MMSYDLNSGSALRWLILGGSGFVGSEVATRLRSGGARVTLLAAPRLEADPALSAAQIADLCVHHQAIGPLSRALENHDVVVNAAGRAEPNAPNSRSLTGANALLPGLVVAAAKDSAIRRVVHVSSAAVQGRRRALTEDSLTQPFSAYSRSKALGEVVALSVAARDGVDCVVVRATSVQGDKRSTTQALRKAARSPFASVAGSGDHPSPVSSASGLADFIVRVGSWSSPIPQVVLQPWEGLSVLEVLEAAGGRSPVQLPAAWCRLAIAAGYAVSAVARHRLDGHIRRVEVMWFGQRVEADWAVRTGYIPTGSLAKILRGPSSAWADVNASPNPKK